MKRAQHANLYVNMCSDFICNGLKIEKTKMSFKKGTVKLWYNSHHGIPNKKK